MSNAVIQAMARHARALQPLHYSAETGSGKTTLLFSHLSRRHFVFAIDAGASITRVKKCPLFNAATVTYIEGPSQLTLPRHTFTEDLQMVLIDGPHGYPFPDLEYYYFYPRIAQGGLLLIDDINIPSIARMVEIIRADDMFELLEIVEYTAFFRRTASAALNPLGDDWWLQGYNRAHYEHAMALARGSTRSRLRVFRRLIPAGIKKRIPVRLKTALLNRFSF